MADRDEAYTPLKSDAGTGRGDGPLGDGVGDAMFEMTLREHGALRWHHRPVPLAVVLTVSAVRLMLLARGVQRTRRLL